MEKAFHRAIRPMENISTRLLYLWKAVSAGVLYLRNTFPRDIIRMETVYYRYGNNFYLRILSLWKLLTIGIV